MALTSGTKLGPYEILAPLGAGGMGEVYRARDTRLGRDVAIKILPEQFSGNPELKQRFEREARVISSLNHPNICHLYDVGQEGSTDYLVMECIEGESLAARLVKGPLPVSQLLKIGSEIADALEKAHRHGIVHRDLKPGNIMLTKSGAKLLDFGLAKPAATVQAASGLGGIAATATGPVSPVTQQGQIVGTFQYMSPEQVEGKEPDARSDIFALGAVLYEMATGKKAFDGKSTISVASAILEKDPEPISKLQPLTPRALEHLVFKCLAKDPDERIQTAHDVKLQLVWMGENAPQASLASADIGRSEHWGRMGWAVAGVLLLVTVIVGMTSWFQTRRSQRTMYFSSPFPFPANDVALSPDGETVALVAYEEHENKYVIWTYTIGSRNANTLPGTEGASHPFWSPDGKSIGFFADEKLKRMDIGSGAPQVVCQAPHGRGGTWSRDGVILFAPNTQTGIYRVSSSGGSPTPVTKPDISAAENSHRWPVFLPDGRHFLYLAANFSGEYEKNTVYAGSLDSPQKVRILAASSNVAYVNPGYLLYVRDNALVAQHFDAKKLAVIGDPHTITGEAQFFPQIDLAVFGVSGEHALVVQTGKGADKSQLVWFDRKGQQLGAVGSAGLITNPALSRDGHRVAFGETDKDGRHVDIWVRDSGSNAVTRMTFTPGLNELPVWSGNDKRIIYTSNQKLHWEINEKNADGSGTEQQIAQSEGENLIPWDCSRDDQYVLMSQTRKFWYVSLRNKQSNIVFDNVDIRNAQFSPDGKWIAYSSDETGAWEVYVSPFPVPSSKWQVSRSGGGEPHWRRDGKELFYVSSEGMMMSTPVKTDTSFESGIPVALFQTHIRQPISATDQVSYDVSPDGQRFLINTKVDEPNTEHLSVILNWASEIER